MYGRELAGHSETATGQAALTATIAAPATSSWRIRTETRGGPASRYAAASAGTIIHPCSIFVMKARPTTAPHHTSAPQVPDEYAAFCARMVRRYAGSTASEPLLATGT